MFHMKSVYKSIAAVASLLILIFVTIRFTKHSVVIIETADVEKQQKPLEQGDISTGLASADIEVASTQLAKGPIDTLKQLLQFGASETEVVAFFESLTDKQWDLVALEFKDILESLRQDHQNSAILAAFGIFIDLWTHEDHLATLNYLNTISKMQLDFDYDVYQSIPLYHWQQNEPADFNQAIEALSENVANEIEGGIAEPLGAYYLRVLAKLYFENDYGQEWLDWANAQEADGNTDTAIVALASISQYAGPEMMEPVAAKLKTYDTDIRLRSAIPEFSVSYVNQEPEQALQWIESLSMNSRHAALQSAFETLTVTEPKRALEWLNNEDVIDRIGSPKKETEFVDLHASEVYDLLVNTFLSTTLRNQDSALLTHSEIEHSIDAMSNPELQASLREQLKRSLENLN